MTRSTAFVVCMIAAFAAFAQGRPVLVTDTETPLQFRGFRTKAPSGTAWYLVFRSDVDVLFFKRLESNTHSFYVRMTITELAENAGSPAVVLDLVRNAFAEGAAPDSRFTPVKFEHASITIDGAACNSYDMRAVDRKVSGSELELSAQGVVCVHPQSSRHAVHATFSERGGPASITPSLAAEGDAFVCGMLMTPLP